MQSLTKEMLQVKKEESGGCLTSQQHPSVSQGRIRSDNSTSCHTEIEVADQTFHLTQSQYTGILTPGQQVPAIECSCAQTRPRFILSSERVLGNETRTHVDTKGRSTLYQRLRKGSKSQLPGGLFCSGFQRTVEY